LQINFPQLAPQMKPQRMARLWLPRRASNRPRGKIPVEFLENTTGGNPFPTPGTGKILRLNAAGTTTEIASGLNLPTGMTFGPDGNIYVSAWGFGPPGMGEIDKVTL
jgi:hypothetical protein